MLHAFLECIVVHLEGFLQIQIRNDNLDTKKMTEKFYLEINILNIFKTAIHHTYIY